MNKYYNFFKNTEGARDYIFQNTCKLLNSKPAKIIEIGCSRNISESSRFSDGWSSYFWYDYVKENGGSLDIYDIDQSALDNCKKLFENLSDENINFICDDGTKYITDNYDLAYLDGSDCPNEMLNQFEKIDRKKTIILCDDFDNKGSILRNIHKDFLLMHLKNTPFEMALYLKN